MWDDSSHRSGWHHEEDTNAWIGRYDAECETMGFLLHEGLTHLTIAQSIAPEIQNRDALMKIPMCAVKRVTRIKKEAPKCRK